MTLIRTLRNDLIPEVNSFVRFLIVSLPQPTVLPIIQPQQTPSPFASFSNPPFFPLVTSPGGDDDDNQEYFDALDYDEPDDTLTASGSGDLGGTTPVFDSQYPQSPTSPNPMSPHITPQPTSTIPTSDEPMLDLVDKPPIYRIWSF